MKKTNFKFYTVISFLLAVVGTKAQYGILPAPYCMPLYSQSPCNQPGPSNSAGNFVNDFIHSVVTIGGNVNINNVNSGCNAQNFPSIGLRNYIYQKCQHNLSVNAGQTITISIQVSNIFSQGVAVYIDWNLDNIFANPTELVAASPSTIPAGGWGTYTFTVPPSQPNGIYRMRVRGTYASAGPAINACNNYAGGETEDYDVYVGTISPAINNPVASSNSTLCSGNTLSLNLSYSSQCTPSYTWAGPNAFLSNSQNPAIANAQPANSGNYTVTVMCNSVCPVTLVTSVTINQSPTTASAGTNMTFCAVPTTTFLAGNFPSVGFGTWSVLQGTNTNIFQPNQANSAVVFNNPQAQSVYVLQWSITNQGCTSASTMSVTFQGPTPANAGPSQSLCMQSTTTLTANTPSSGTGAWTLVSGSGTIASPNSPTTGITALGTGTNVFKWTITHPSCGSSQSQMTVTNFVTPTLSAVSNPTTICSGDQATLTASGAYQYIWQPSGTGSMIVVSPSVSSTYTVIGNSGPCFGSPITVSVNVDPAPSQAVAPPSISICTNVATLIANTPSAGTGIWSFLSGSGTLINLNTPTLTYQSIGLGSNILQWKITLGNCTSTSTTLVQNNGITLSATSNTAYICSGGSATLTASSTANSYTWLPAGGNASIAIVTPTATTIYTVTGTNGTCTANSTITQSVVICTGLNAVSVNNDELKIYPNPFKDELKIVSQELIQIKLMDVSGKEVLRKDIDGETLINTSSLAKGVYFIHVVGDKAVKPVKLIKD
jgi:hypothetical protein